MNPSSFDVPPPPCHKRWGLCRRMTDGNFKETPSDESEFF
nr:MAG TPA: hypothetical protein [Caudoviricetes sp.]